MNTATVLIVEDEKILRDALRVKFMHEDFRVLEAQNGEEGLGAALAEHPDVILLDIVMPVMDGITMLQKLREDDWGRTAKVIMLSNLGGGDEITRAIEQGARGYLVKTDWHLADVVNEVNKVLQK